MLHGDGRRFRQVLYNLVSNAIKFTESGSVTVTARHVAQTQAHDGLCAGLYVDVIDTGIGISTGDQDRIFAPFGQSESQATRQYGGTGLGLTISRDLCRAMGGDLTVTSTVGAGSTFSVYLPFDKLSASQPDLVPDGRSGKPADTELIPLHILIVDDTRANRFILSKFLKSVAGTLSEAESGVAACAYVEVHDVDVILMDIQMPEMDGIAATQEILRMLKTQGRPLPRIVGVTANALQNQIDDYIAAGMARVLPKPVSKPALIADIAAEAQRRATLLADDVPDANVA